MRALVLLLSTGVAFADASLHAPTTGTHRWLAGGLPLAAAGARGLRSPGKDACAWIRPGGRWRAIDSYGATLGEHAVRQISEPGCVAELGEIEARAALFQSPDAAAPRPTARRTASARESAELRRLSAATGEASTDGEALFFSTADGTRWAAGGGRRLAVTRLDGDHLTVVFRRPLRKDQTYRLLAAVDLDGDGVPELIYQHVDVDVWNAEVLRFDGASWRVIASGMGGDFV